MQQHTGQHLLSAVMDKYDNLETLGWGMGSDGGISYVELPRKPSKEEIEEIQSKCNEIIRRNLEVTIDIPHVDHDEAKGIVRIVKIGDLDANPYLFFVKSF